MKHLMSIITAVLFCSTLLTSCAAPNARLDAQCESLLNQAERQLADAKSKGFSGAVEITKATGLISAARIQQQFNKYPNCIDKAKRAMAFIRKSQMK